MLTKKSTITASLLSLAAFMAAPATVAQESSGTALPGSLDFLEVKDVKLYTGHILVDGQPQVWNGEGLHAGIQVFSFYFGVYKEKPADYEVPADPTAYCTISDLAGNVVATNKRDLTQIFRLIKLSSNYHTTQNFSMGVTRGGKYKLTGGISPELYTYSQEIVLNDEPGAQVTGTTVKVDDGLSPIVTITSGYPYDPQSIAGTHSMHWTVTSASDPSKIVADKTESFELSSETETLAAIAELTLTVPDAEPGEYIFTLESDYTPANRTFKAVVNDALHPELSLDKSMYEFGVDQEAVLSVKMTYGYPYIALDTATEEHTVTVNPMLLNQSNPIHFSDPAWADSEMNLSKDIKISFADVTLDDLKENNGKLPLRVLISFNGAAQSDDTLEVPFEYDSTGIGSVTASTPGEVKYYNIFGTEVDASYRGIVITSTGTKLYRK